MGQPDSTTGLFEFEHLNFFSFFSVGKKFDLKGLFRLHKIFDLGQPDSTSGLLWTLLL